MLTNLDQIFLKKITPQQFVDHDERDDREVDPMTTSTTHPVPHRRRRAAASPQRTDVGWWLAAPALVFFLPSPSSR